MDHPMFVRLAECINEQALLSKLESGKTLHGYWGTAPTGRCHVGYLVPLLKMAECVKAGCRMTVLLADVHAFLDARKSGLEDEARCEYYEWILTAVLRDVLKVDMSRITFVRGSSFQLSRIYMTDFLRLLNSTSVKQAQHAGAEVVKQADDPSLGGLVYPLMQTLDEVHLAPDLDFELGGVDQRKIFCFSLDHLKRSNPFAYLMNTMLPGLRGQARTEMDTSEKMSASDPIGKIDLLDTPKEIVGKIKRTFCVEGTIEENSLLPLCEHVLFPVLTYLDKSFIVPRAEKHGGPFHLDSFSETCRLFRDGLLHPADLKLGMSAVLGDLLAPVRRAFEEDEGKALLMRAYP